jgi:hypothetical protein
VTLSNQIQALEATLAEMAARAERAEAEVARLKALPPTQASPPVDPRRVVGAVVGFAGYKYIVVAEGDVCQRGLHNTVDKAPTAVAKNDDTFLRWATPEECARHGIPYVARDAQGVAGADLRALRDEYVDALALEGENGSMESGRRFIAARRALAAALDASGVPQSKGKAVKS